MIDLLDKIRTAVVAILRRPKDLLIFLLVVTLGVLSWQVKSERKKWEDIDGKLHTLPPDTNQIIQVARNHVIERWRDGPTRVEYRDRYLPPEGSATLYIRKGDQAMAAAPVIKDHGFTLRPGGGIVFSGRLMPEGDVKWFYFRRYSLLGAVSPEFAAAGLSRHIDDISPFTNVELTSFCGISWQGDFRLGVGLRSNF